jgi:hypothetical protein
MIRVDRIGVTAKLSHCAQCEWQACFGDDGVMPADVVRLVRQHVQKTGHTVTIETGSTATYRKDGE